nr:aldehyde dehydrogenase family 3 member H1 [Tanacetum cinerariifolium]
MDQFDRHDMFKVVLVVAGHNELHYATRSFVIDQPALVFTNRLIPYAWESADGPTAQQGHICCFSESFLHAALRGVSLRDSELYKVGGNPVYLLDAEQPARHHHPRGRPPAPGPGPAPARQRRRAHCRAVSELTGRAVPDDGAAARAGAAQRQRLRRAPGRARQPPQCQGKGDNGPPDYRAPARAAANGSPAAAYPHRLADGRHCLPAGLRVHFSLHQLFQEAHRHHAAGIPPHVADGGLGRQLTGSPSAGCLAFFLMTQTKAYAAQSPDTDLAPWTLERRDVGPHDVQIEIAFCGVCHSDLHLIKNDWFPGLFPMVPGHEIVGRVTQVGDHVRKFTVGSLVGVGCMVDSCQHCVNCAQGLEQFCVEGATQTYNNPDRSGHPTYGGYSSSIVVREEFVEADAKALGAHHFVVTKDEAQLKAVSSSFDFILDTVAADHDIPLYLSLLKVGGTHVLVGVPPKPLEIPAFALIAGRKSVAGSMIGGIAETQEMLDYCAEHNIVSDIELIDIKDITQAYERMVKGDVRYRFVIDLATLQEMLAAAQRIVFSRGVSALRMAALAFELGVSTKTLYTHFASKEVLLEAVMDAYYHYYAELYQAVLHDPALDFLSRLKQTMRLGWDINNALTAEATQDFRRNAPTLLRSYEQKKEASIQAMIAQHTFDFLKRLEQNNSTDWVNAHRDELDETKADVVAFAAVLVKEISKFDSAIAANPPEPKKCVTRLNRDMRYGKSKGPYKTNFYVVVGAEGIQGVAASYCVYLESGKCFVGGGAPNPMGADLLNYRKKVSDNFDDFTKIVNSSSFKSLFSNGITSQSGVVKKRMPRGFEADDPAAEYLKKEGFITRESVTDQDVMTEEGLKKIVKLLKGSQPAAPPAEGELVENNRLPVPADALHHIRHGAGVEHYLLVFLDSRGFFDGGHDTHYGAVAHLEEWMAPVKVEDVTAAASAYIRYESRGVVLLFSAWNFPFTLLFEPLIPIIAAGNTVIVKPNEVAPASSRVAAAIIREAFVENEVAVFEGGVKVADILLGLPFDHIFLTGSPRVGRTVMAAAAQHLASVTLELGGKSPLIVDETSDFDAAIPQMAFGKTFNGGQVCISPDYVLVPNSRRDEFVAKLGAFWRQMLYADGTYQPARTSRVINERGFQRLQGYLTDALARGAKVAFGGGTDPEKLVIEPTILLDVPAEADVMQNEIFGPLLPVVGYDDADDAIAHVQAGTKPLALYLLSTDEVFIQRVIENTSSGGVSINGWAPHYQDKALPFGGVGESGMGNYHGAFGFRELSHARAVAYARPLQG